MGDQIGINVGVFTSNINALKASAGAIEFSPSASLSKTDIDPFKEYQTTIQDLSTALAGYKTIIENDAQQMAGIGQAIANADKKTSGK